MAKAVTLDDSFVGNTEEFEVTIVNNGVPWEGADSVTFVFTPPSNSGLEQFERAGEVVSAVDGVWHYVCTEDDLNVAGWWKLRVRVLDGDVTKTYPVELGFYVHD